MIMKRRTFTKLTGLSAIAITTTGFIKFNGESYVGDCETTTDILGPFYRPDSPMRTNLIIKGMPGKLVELSGIVRHKDCTTPYNKAKIELWHCSADEVYDNDSEDYLYRGTTHCDENGTYNFTTQMPVPYDVGDGTIRPAHFHMMVSAPGYQSLVTQIYFTGDPYLEKDASAASEEAKKRILDVSQEDGMLKVVFDCNMNDRLKVSYDSLAQIIGKYKNDKTAKMLELFEREGLLWMKNEVFGESFDYVGENKFEYPGMTEGAYNTIQFNLNQKDAITFILTTAQKARKKSVESFTKV